MERWPNPNRQEAPPDDFEQCGGKILERDDAGKPTRWTCGWNSRGDLVHPAEAKESEVVSYIATVKRESSNDYYSEWQGAVQNHEAVKDYKLWLLE
ncbi:hypothetical protein A2V68_02955 [candidate division Kazan bacterium RBG_13_50_9]|uniref:Uncharacterized protein n=1 Tax=candidate division Kazan bacterium RBG_13_50_9 TaxID=1798535 RepID=A0A1F4NSW1_UNCK3|nr:MAG: hypothetical protein A2V68_02955 [candidate division Kazan bacterium RBG_13_50_9]